MKYPPYRPKQFTLRERHTVDQANLDEIVTIKLLEQISAPQTGSSYSCPIRKRLSILFIVKGSGKCLHRGEVIDLQDKTVYTGFSDCFQQFDIGEGTVGYLLGINPQNLTRVFESVTVVYEGLFATTQPCLRLDAESAEEMNWVVTRILKEAGSKEKYRMEIVHRYISLLLLYLKSQLKNELVLVSMNRKGILIKGFFALLEDAFMIAKTVDYYAGKLCVTAKHLSSVIKMESGYPTSYHINQRIVLEAKRMAQASGACLKEIAYELGYEDVSAFSKLFKRVTGETFSDYKCHLKFGFGKPEGCADRTSNKDIN
ncbi:AraC-like DNA-binding protein [Chitinophaga niastensis]|uniref:AraC-like DNA-binding protein n=1 Tax=Chitinophaga niastensis TaxID=536980 RepID=A0A2P8H9V9_CHINA|nr:helix-turn-helix domain-containing protein [Chitinophaga niastensis]PSL43013.1 AraC-like DNA-binding protein [Chitinophaga niastensis]